MTLIVRLAFLSLAGAIIAALTYFLLWPSAPLARSTAHEALASSDRFDARYAGEYVAKEKLGSYKLSFSPEGSARLNFVDRKGKHFGYRGEIAEGKIVWRKVLKGRNWVDLKTPVDDELTLESLSTVVTREGRFERVKK